MTTLGNTNLTQHSQSPARKAGRFLLHLFEMLLAMEVGMGLFHLIQWLVPASPGLIEALKPGTNLHVILMTVFMTIPMVAWMVIRGHGWRHSGEMAIVMLAPMAIIILLCWLGVDTYVPWLIQISSPAMYLAMLAYMLYRRDHFTGQAHQSTDTEFCHTN